MNADSYNSSDQPLNQPGPAQRVWGGTQVTGVGFSRDKAMTTLPCWPNTIVQICACLLGDNNPDGGCVDMSQYSQPLPSPLTCFLRSPPPMACIWAPRSTDDMLWWLACCAKKEEQEEETWLIVAQQNKRGRLWCSGLVSVVGGRAGSGGGLVACLLVLDVRRCLVQTPIRSHTQVRTWVDGYLKKYIMLETWKTNRVLYGQVPWNLGILPTNFVGEDTSRSFPLFFRYLLELYFLDWLKPLGIVLIVYFSIINRLIVQSLYDLLFLYPFIIYPPFSHQQKKQYWHTYKSRAA